jgi:hypothetical protein
MMAAEDRMHRTDRDPFEIRRRKEQAAFLVVKFLRAGLVFRSVSDEFELFARSESPGDGRLFEKVRELVEGHLFELKERAHALFRADAAAAPVRARRTRTAHPKAGAETRTLDAYIGTAYHLMLILQESVYQVERYAPELDKEHDELSAAVATDAVALARRAVERCRALFAGTEEVIRRFAAASRDNEVLILNLVLHRDLLTKVYGEAAANAVFDALTQGPSFHGATGYERALTYARAKCGNVTALPGAPGLPGAPSPPAAAAAPA